MEHSFIKLVSGEKVLIDEEVREYLNQFKWYNNKGYAIRLNGKKWVLMHREILNLLDKPNVYVDHKNMNRLDNRKCNLRIATPQNNAQNKRKYRNKKSSKYKGVFYEKDRKKWRVIIGHNGQLVHCGRYTTELEAVKIYNQWAIKLFGKFANINKIED